MIYRSIPPRRAQLLAATSGLSLLMLAAPGNAQAPVTPEPDYDSRGIRLDHSHVYRDGVGKNQETEGAEFNSLAKPSNVSAAERRTVFEDQPTGPTIEVDAKLGGTNFESGRAVLLPATRAKLDGLIADLRGKRNLRFRVAGHTDSQRIAERLKPIYPTNDDLSRARAYAVADYLAQGLNLPIQVFTMVGRGEHEPIASNDTPAGMAANRRTEILVRYDDDTPAPPPKAVEKVVAVDYCEPDVKGPALPFSISVDGRPVDADTTQTEGDRQRCVDVALDRADIQVKYDPLNVAPSLNAWMAPGAVRRGETVRWRTYTNYAYWLERSEIRVFARGQTTQEQPIAIVPVPVGGEASWAAPVDLGDGAGYVLRVYDRKGRFDETAIKPLELLDAGALEPSSARAREDELSGWGENALKIHNINASGGAVTISGENVKADEKITALGMPVPVDDNGKFAFRQILPAGPHTVDVAVQDGKGRTATFNRNLSIADKDWFYIAVADLTASTGKTSGPAGIVTGDTFHYNNDTTIDGRAAFYLKGKVLGSTLLTASADTREQPLKNLFSNFDRKDPYYLLRRIDPNKYYPIYGDDSSSVDDAPTQGKFYVRLEREGSHVMWGNFQTSWTGTELTQYTRGLYGADLVWNSKGSTTHGERNTQLEAFAADPGTLQSREEFRGTGGSLYYLRRQDLTEGSDRLWVEIRDKDSGIVLQRTALAPGQDYDIDYLQGRVTLRAPLGSTADGGPLVQTSTLNGNPVYLVASYEYVPGLTAVKGSTIGVRGSQWLGDHIRLGGTYYHQGDGGFEQELTGADAMLRYKPGTWLKGEVARSKGVGAEQLSSLTGGFDFVQNNGTGESANAYRIDAAVDLNDLSSALQGRINLYWQQRQRGFSGPGLTTVGGEALRQGGVAAVLPIGERGEVAVKADDYNQSTQGKESAEVAVRYKLNAEWGVSAGLRRDDYRTTTGAAAGGLLFNSSPELALNGERTDGLLRVDYRPLKSAQSQPAGSAMKIEGLSAAGPQRYLTAPSSGVVTADNSGPAASLVPSAINGAGGVANPVTDPTAAAGIAAARVEGLEYKPWNLYGFAQGTLQRSGARADNNRGGVGAAWQVNDRLKVGAEGSTGDGGFGGKLSTDFQLNNRSNLYMTYSRETEVADQNYAGRQGVLTAGGRTRLNDQLGVFTETKRSSGEGQHSLTHGFGVDFAPAKNWTTSVKAEMGRLSDRTGGDLKRRAVSVSAGYKDERLKALTSIEYRRDRTSSLGSTAGTCGIDELQIGNCVTAAGDDGRETWLFKSNVSYQATPSWRLLGSLNMSRSSSKQGAFYDGDYTEAVLGAAFRPVDNDRWNTLFKYTYFYNLPSSGQTLGEGLTNGPLDYTQRSHVLNFDTIYDVTPWMSLGFKYGLRFGELRDSRVGGDWYSSQAQLAVLRGDFHFVKEWDAVVELRNLRVLEAKDSRTGALVALYRHVGPNAKLGVGYNFTDYSDDLTDLSYRSRGFFFNALATF